jgi:hypothetical protein
MSNAVADIIAYHDRTKHQPERYANGPHGLDWASQPNPFRRFTGAPVLRLPLGGLDDTPLATTLFGAANVTPRPLTIGTLSLFLELSLGLSARKEIADSSWYLRMNPSSGNLHPTEAYAVLPAIEGLPDGPGECVPLNAATPLGGLVCRHWPRPARTGCSLSQPLTWFLGSPPVWQWARAGHEKR